MTAMKAKLRTAALLALLVAAGLLVGCGHNETEAHTYAESILKMKDRGQYRDMYREKFDAKMRDAMNEDRWIQTAQGVDRVVGSLTSRELKSSGYSLLCFCYKFRYKARYQNFQGFDEVYVSKEGDDFKLSGIWLKPH